jgi:hypothetical protein
MSNLFLSLLITFFFSSSVPTTTETTTPTEVVSTKSTFEALSNEFTTCDKLDKVLEAGTCGAFKEFKGKEAKTKVESLSSKLFALIGKETILNSYGRESLLETAMVYDETAESYDISTINKAAWGDLVFLSFTISSSSSPMENEAATVLVFTKTGEFKSAFSTHTYSGGSQVITATDISKVEKTEESLKLIVNEAMQSEDGEETEKVIGFYSISKDGTVTYEASEK